MITMPLPNKKLGGYGFLPYITALIHMVLFAVLLKLYEVGHLDVVFQNDPFWVSTILIGIFSLFSLFTIRTSYVLGNDAKNFGNITFDVLLGDDPTGRDDRYEAFYNSRMNYIKVLRYTSGFFVFAGLIGTVLGLVVAFNGVDSNLNIENPEVVKKVIADMLGGLGFAFMTTLVGSICALWIEFWVFLLNHTIDRTMSQIQWVTGFGDAS